MRLEVKTKGSLRLFWIINNVDKAHYDAGLEFCAKYPRVPANQPRKLFFRPNLKTLYPIIRAFAQSKNVGDHKKCGMPRTESAEIAFSLVERSHERA